LVDKNGCGFKYSYNIVPFFNSKGDIIALVQTIAMVGLEPGTRYDFVWKFAVFCLFLGV